MTDATSRTGNLRPPKTGIVSHFMEVELSRAQHGEAKVPERNLGRGATAALVLADLTGAMPSYFSCDRDHCGKSRPIQSRRCFAIPLLLGADAAASPRWRSAGDAKPFQEGVQMESGFVLDRRTRALWVLRILVACRVSVLSMAAGTLLFLLATQARDLFADTAFGALPASPGAWGFWIAFFTYLVFVWAFPVHYAARRMLYSNAWMFSCRVRADIAPRRITEVRKELSWWIDWIPQILGRRSVYFGPRRTLEGVGRRRADEGTRACARRSDADLYPRSP